MKSSPWERYSKWDSFDLVGGVFESRPSIGRSIGGTLSRFQSSFHLPEHKAIQGIWGPEIERCDENCTFSMNHRQKIPALASLVGFSHGLSTRALGLLSVWSCAFGGEIKLISISFSIKSAFFFFFFGLNRFWFMCDPLRIDILLMALELS